MSTAKPFLSENPGKLFERVWKRRIKGVTGLTDRLDELITAGIFTGEIRSWPETRPG
jgi:hypothetical protein